jgi:cytochrome c-type biogenesis protein CcmH
MSLFWSIAAAMLILAFAFVLPPLFRRSGVSTVNRDELNIELIKQQLDELKTDLNNGKLDTADYAAARKDLENELLYDVSTGHASTPKPEKSGRWASAVLIIAIPLTAVLLYQRIGTGHLTPVQQDINAAGDSSVTPSQDSLPSVQELVTKLAERMESEPNNPEGWYLLARSYMSIDRYNDAANAYERVHRLVGDQAEILVGYADALAMVHEGKLAGKPAELLQRALELQPNQPQGLWLAGMAAEQQGNYQDAINYWHRLEPLLQEDQDSLREVRQLIARAEQRGGIPIQTAEDSNAQIPAPTPTSASDSATTSGASFSGKAITINVDLDPGLKEAAAYDDSLFIFAQAVKGPPMPLAVVRKQVKDLPLVVTLDDSMAMMPAMSLSNFSEVKIGARISKTGNATPQSGDLYGEVSPVEVDDKEPVQITIGERVP